jgi:formylglycine-generating enzyme required for sulfatase activity
MKAKPQLIPTGARLLLPLCAFLLIAAAPARASQPPVITDVTASQAALPSKDVNISYSISDPNAAVASVFIRVSTNSGATWTVPATNFTGDVGTNVSTSAKPKQPAAKSAVWHAGTDWNGQFSTTCRVRVVANNDPNFVLIPPGTYERGDSSGDPDITDAHVYPVFVSGFFIEKNPVTVGQWNFVVQSYATSHGYTDLAAAGLQAPDHPVVSTTWYDAVQWCNARSEMDGLTPVYYTNSSLSPDTVYRFQGTNEVYIKFGNASTNGYRLPTEAEWEKAARGGLVGKRFPWGDTIANTPPASGGQANYFAVTSNTGGGGFHYDLGPDGYNSAFNRAPSPVGSFPANGYGLFDMAGNAATWCWDWYSTSSYASGQTDPQGPATAQAPLFATRVIRGGGYDYDSRWVRCAARFRNGPGGNGSGLRCVRGL